MAFILDLFRSYRTRIILMAQHVIAVVFLIINLLDNFIETLWCDSSIPRTIFQRADRQSLAQQELLIKCC